MDATRTRRTKDLARQTWYARHRQRRFARFLGFGTAAHAGCDVVGAAAREAPISTNRVG